MQNTLDEFEIITPQRPVFLKVLCILTFIGSGLGLISSCITYFNADKMLWQSNQGVRIKVDTSKVDTSNVKRANSSKSNFALRMANESIKLTKPENVRKSAIGNFISSLFCLAGAILMWRLKRFGYYIYILGTLVGVLAPFYLFGNNIVTGLQTGVASFIGILFIIFYGMNFKSLK